MKHVHSFFKILCISLTLTMLLSSFAACGKGEGEVTTSDDTSSVAVTTEPITEQPLGDPIVLTSEFVLVCGDTRNDAVLILANSLKNKIKAKTGISLALGYAASPKEKEIILGYEAGREVTKLAYDTIVSGDYTIHTDGTKVVLGAWTQADLSAAADLLIEKALVQEGDQWLIYPQRVNQGSTDTAGVSLSQYRIVYPADASAYLKNTIVPHLQDMLKQTFDVELSAVGDNEAASTYEIVLGSTNRDTDATRAYLSGGAHELPYYGHAIVTEGTRIHLLSRSDVALYAAAASLCAQSVPELGPAVFCMSAEPWVSPAADTDDVAELAAGADIRVMSYNILHPSWSNVVSNVPVEGRDALVTDVLLYYMPDVVGLQETNANWHANLKKLLVDTGLYGKACERNNAKSYNMTTFLYNTQTVKPVDEYVVDLDKNSDIRVFSVAVFEKLSDGTRFVVTNTHPAPTGQAENYARNFADIMTHAKTELAKYATLPVIMTGDFNTKEQSSMYQNFLSATGVKDAKYEAEVLVRDYCTFSGWPNVAPKAGNSNCIDHIFVNDHAAVKLFNVVIDHDVRNASDHIPIYADIDLK